MRQGIYSLAGVEAKQPTFSMSKYTQNIFPSRLFCQKKNFIKQLKPNHNNQFMLFAI
jgi:hypothetical protein